MTKDRNTSSWQPAILRIPTLVGDFVRRIAFKTTFTPSMLRSCSRSDAPDFVSVSPAPVATKGEAEKQTLAGRLGYGPHARLLIVHADDLGLAQGVNTALFDGLVTGLINSGSVMVPCPWFDDVVAFGKTHPEADIGLHLTIKGGWTGQRWAPVAPPPQVSSLVDREGYFHQSWTSETPVNPEEVEIELRAQIEKAYAAGLCPTHLDSHEFALQLRRRDLFEVYLGLGREYHLPVLIARPWFARFPYLQVSLTQNDVVLDQTVTITPQVAPDQWSVFYRRALEELLPGVTEFVIHPGYDNEELRAAFGNRQAWGAAWRQRDFDFFTSYEFRDLLAKYDIKLITWREIATRLKLDS
jgi:chitin disaccharide deacetylase